MWVAWEWVWLQIRWDDEYVWEPEHSVGISGDRQGPGQSQDSGRGPRAAPNLKAQDQFPLLLLSSLSAPATRGGGGIFSLPKDFQSPESSQGDHLP